MRDGKCNNLNWLPMGEVPFQEALEKQNQILQMVADGKLSPALLTLQHPKTVTMGKNSSLSNLLTSQNHLENSHIEFVKTDRGGEITGHEMGQLVAYPILPIADMGVRSYVCKLEQAVIDTLEYFDIKAKRDAINPGVWVGQNKICALGIRVKKRVSMHGIALNVNNTLDIFQVMTPCGIADRGVTSMQKIKKKKISFTDVEHEFVRTLSKTFEFNAVNQVKHI